MTEDKSSQTDEGIISDSYAAREKKPLGLSGNIAVIALILATLLGGYLIHEYRVENVSAPAPVADSTVVADSSAQAVVVVREVYRPSWDNSPYWLFTLALMVSVVGGFWHRAIGAVFGSIAGFLIAWSLIGPFASVIFGAIGYWIGMFATDAFVFLMHYSWSDRDCDLIE